MKTKMIDSYDKLPLGIYLDILAVCEDGDMDETDRQVRIVSLLSGSDEPDLLRMPIAGFRAMSVKAAFLEEEVPPRTRPLTKTLHLGDMEVAVLTKVTQVTTAQFVDYQSFVGDRSRLVETLACFLIPVGCDYNEGYDMQDVYQAIRDYLTVTDARALAAFFLRRWMRLLGSSLIYSRVMAMRIRDRKTRTRMKAETRRAWEAFTRNGDGWITFAHLLIPPASRGLRYGA